MRWPPTARHFGLALPAVSCAGISSRAATGVDGLLRTKVLAIAVDAAGTRWFGGGGGISRLAANEEWSHFTTANSGLHQNTVAAIAVTANDTLYLSHGLPGGPVSRRQADGSWHWLPNRESAIRPTMR